MKKLLEKCLEEFQHIASGRTGSMGSFNNVYLPQIGKKRLDDLISEVKSSLEQANQGEHELT